MIGVIGLDAHVAPAGLRGRLGFVGPRLADAVRRLIALPALDEVVILSTCQRTEVYVAAETWPAAQEAVTRFLAATYRAGPEAPIPALPQGGEDSVLGAKPPWADGSIYQLQGSAAARHVLCVAAGLRSLVLGETQILAQVKEALAAAEAVGAVGDELRTLFIHATRAGRRVRAETALGRVDDSLAAAAVRQAEVAHGGLAGTAALVIGAGRTGRLAAHLLRAAGIGRLLVCNRSMQAATELAMDLSGEAIPLCDVAAAIPVVETIVSATSAPRVILDLATVARGLNRRAAPLVIVDLASPPDVDAAVGGLPGVALYPLDVLRGGTDPQQVVGCGQAEALVDQECSAWLCACRMRQIVPGIVALRRHVDRSVRAQPGVQVANERQLAGRQFHTMITRLRALAADDNVPVEAIVAALDGYLAEPEMAQHGRRRHTVGCTWT